MKESSFYADNEMVSSTYPGWIQLVLNVLTEIFERVGLRTNVQKTVGMVCRTYRAAGVQAYEAYTRRITG